MNCSFGEKEESKFGFIRWSYCEVRFEFIFKMTLMITEWSDQAVKLWEKLLLYLLHELWLGFYCETIITVILIFRYKDVVTKGKDDNVTNFNDKGHK